MMCLGIVGALIPLERTVAQTSGKPARLTVRPRELATGTQNPQAGEYPLDSIADAIVTVPPQCVGAKRCPLLVQLPGAGYGGTEFTEWLGPAAKKYGFILLASAEPAVYDAGLLDASLREVFRRFAIDPDKIAVMGRCASGARGMEYGIDNLGIFGRIGSISGGAPTADMDPQNKTAEFFLDAGYPESRGNFEAAQALQRNGHPVKLAIGFRGHEHQVEDYDFLGRWLQESWAKPDPATRTAPSVVADPLPMLTTEVLARMTAFWTSFQQEPDLIRTTARRAHLREVVVPVGEDRPSAWMTDMPALAAKYPSIAAALERAGLTAEQHEAYRVALLGAKTAQYRWDGIGPMERLVGPKKVVKFGSNQPWPVEPTSVQGKNLEFATTHPDEFAALWATGMWRTP